MQFPQSRSGCPIATTLDCMGDSWTLIIVRDMLTGKLRYGEFLTGRNNDEYSREPAGTDGSPWSDRKKSLSDQPFAPRI